MESKKKRRKMAKKTHAKFYQRAIMNTTANYFNAIINIFHMVATADLTKSKIRFFFFSFQIFPLMMIVYIALIRNFCI